MSCPARTYPLKRPDGHQPPVPRWHLQFDDEVSHVYATYIGVQLRKDAQGSRDEAAIEKGVAEVTKTIRACVGTNVPGSVVEEFTSMDWNDEDIRHVFVCYWSNHDRPADLIAYVKLRKLRDDLPEHVRPFISIWRETFSVPISRLETNYSGLDYLPGFARLPKTRTEEHTLTAYWGAARDRLGASADDLFEGQNETGFSKHGPDGEGDHIVIYNVDNMVHIRTGQFWENCPEEEVYSYEHNLEPTLRSGISYLRSTESSGAIGLRYLRNANPPSSHEQTEPLKESCVTSVFTSLDALENWAKSHKSHLAIYNGAMRHAKKFGPDRKFRTWHEVVVLKESEGRFEYLNCEPTTGVLGRVERQKKSDQL